MADEEEQQPIIIKKINKGGHGHHGGAWKVAYADFVTAMMAFFLLMWLLNVTTAEQKNAISNYFDPTNPKISKLESGSGGLLAGTTISDTGALSSNRDPVVSQPPNSSKTGSKSNKKDDDGKKQKTKKSNKEKFIEKLKKQEEERLKKAAEQIKQAIEDNPDLAELAKNLLIDMTPEGLRIQLVDQNGRSMFPSGSARMFDHTEQLLGQVAGIAQTLPNDISVRGHTDGSQYQEGADYTNWELSSDRANASRRSLLENGIPKERIANVQGKADTDHLFPDTPFDPRNRRISIILLNQDFSDIELPEGMEDNEEELEEAPPYPSIEEDEEQEESGEELSRDPKSLYNKSQGSVEFP